MKLCGSLGHKAKDGRACGYKIADSAASCPHHALDKSTARAFQAKGVALSQSKRIPENIDVSALDTPEELLQLYAQVAKSAAKEKNPDLKRLDVIIRACNGANAVHQTKAIKDLNDTLMRTEGHGPAFVFLERLKAGPSRPLPGMRVLPAKEPTA